MSIYFTQDAPPEVEQKVLQDPNHCPFCGSENIDASSAQMPDGEENECHTCGKIWMIVYKAVGVLLPKWS